MKNRKLVALCMALVMLAVLCGCGGNQADTADSQIEETARFLLSATPAPAPGSQGGDWLVFGLARSGLEVPEGYLEGYCERLFVYVKEMNGVLDDRKYTEYSRTILALTALGKDPANVEGHNLLIPLASFEKTVFQGINGPAYALLALDSGGYDVPAVSDTCTQATREMYVDYILEKELPGGGWAMAGGEAEIDVTAMTLQALAKYRDRTDVAEAVDRALTVLSEQQNQEGGYTAYSVDSSETVSQVIVALTELGISNEDPRFVKNGRTLRDRLLDFMTEDNGFVHLLGDEVNQLATEQAFYALVALDRAENGKASLYTMTQP